jgi:hypothetical protein
MNTRWLLQSAVTGFILRTLASVILLLSLSACVEGPLRESYRLVLPELPAVWEDILGQACWQLEWIDGDGDWKIDRLPVGEISATVSLAETWASPIIAWPYWPERGLLPETMRPAGAVFPWDVSGDRVELSWQGGIDACFWKELAAAEKGIAGGRFPWKFDWPRFRELLNSDNVSEEIRADPWTADWKAIALKTSESGFDRRRIVSRKKREIAVSGLDTEWINTSPFAGPRRAASGELLRLPAGTQVETWVSRLGILRCTQAVWVFLPAPSP